MCCKRFFALMLSVIMLCLSAVPAAAAPVSQPEPVRLDEPADAESLEKRENIILNAYLVPLLTTELRDKMFSLCRDADIDVLSHVYVAPDATVADHTYAAYKEIMEHASRYGLQVLTREIRLRDCLTLSDEEIIQTAKEYASLPGFAGFFVVDEPYYPNEYARVENLLRTVCPDALVNVNFLPASSYPTGLYEKQLTDYGSLIPTGAVLSMDCYCFGPNGGVDEASLFSNYNAIRLSALKTNCNTALYVQSVGHPGSYRTPSEGDLRYNMMAALAYGSKEIKFFTWGTSDSGKYEDAIIGMDYEPTARYEYVKKINRKIHAIGTRLAACDALQVYHSTQSAVYDKLPADSFIQLDGDTQLIISYMQERNGSGEYVMFVNKNFTSAQTFTFSFTGSGALQLVNDTTGNLEALTAADGQYTVTLQAGDGMLIRLPEGDYIQPQRADSADLAQNAAYKATSSTADTTYYTCHLFDKTADGKPDTSTAARLTSGDGLVTDPYITLDFGSVQSVNRVDLYPAGTDADCGRYFPNTVTVLGSADGQSWTRLTYASSSNIFLDKTKVPVLTFDSAEVRYLRLVFGGFPAEGLYCELSAVCVYNDSGDGSIPMPDATSYVQETVESGSDLAYGKAIVDVSSIAAAGDVDISVLTGKSRTLAWRTSPHKNEFAASEEYFTCDLGGIYAIDRVKVTPTDDTEHFPRDFSIQVSVDGVHFTTVGSLKDIALKSRNDSAVVTFDAVPARYVRFYATRLSENGHYLEIRHFSVYGTEFTGTLPAETETEPIAAETEPTETDTLPVTEADTVPADTTPTETGCKSVLLSALPVALLAAAVLLLSVSGRKKRLLK